MKKLICGILAVLLLAGFLTVGPMQVSAASNLTTSENAIQILKDVEGFSQYAYKDSGQYSIGYGCSCNPSDYPNGITLAQADALLRERLAGMEASVNKFADRYSLMFTQQQFDALMLFTYNCGAGWTNADSDFRTSVIRGDQGNDFIYYITRWCTANNAVNKALVDRRLAEADLYLYGYYNLHAPSNYSYVLFDANGGTCDSRIQGYDASEPVKVRVEPLYSGYRFLGWYTAADGGKWITDLDATTMGMTLYAHWQKTGDGAETGTAASYQRKAGEKLIVYAAPSVESEASGEVDQSTTLDITADYLDENGVKWGKTAQGWVKLTGTTVDTKAAAKPERVQDDTGDGLKVMVTANDVNVRSGAGTEYTRVGSVGYGQSISITEVKIVNQEKWGKFSKGWICLSYTNYDAVVGSGDTGSDTVIATGTVKNCGGLRVRSGAGVSYFAVGTLAPGTAVSITEIKNVGNVQWGKIASGWICLDYVDLKMVDSSDKKDDSTASDEKKDDIKDDSATSDDKKDDSSASDERKDDSSASGDQNNGTTTQVTGAIISNTALNIRKGAGTGYAVVGGYARGTKVVILEQKSVNGTPWGRTAKGWICLNYVKLDSNASDSNSGSGNSNSGTSGSTTAVTGKVSCNGYLNVRAEAGTNGKRVSSLKSGTAVTILETKKVGNVTWGRIDKGWICMTYVKLDSGSQTTTPNTDSDKNTGSTGSDSTSAVATGRVINTNSLRIRSGAGTGYSIVGGLSMGTSVKIYEVKTVSGVLWGRMDKGWICLTYVKLDSGSNVVIMTGKVTANLNVRRAAGTQSAIVGGYAKGAKVEIYETTTVSGQSWGRTEKGWICLNYVA